MFKREERTITAITLDDVLIRREFNPQYFASHTRVVLAKLLKENPAISTLSGMQFGLEFIAGSYFTKVNQFMCDGGSLKSDCILSYYLILC